MHRIQSRKTKKKKEKDRQISLSFFLSFFLSFPVSLASIARASERCAGTKLGEKGLSKDVLKSPCFMLLSER